LPEQYYAVATLDQQKMENGWFSCERQLLVRRY